MCPRVILILILVKTETAVLASICKAALPVSQVTKNQAIKVGGQANHEFGNQKKEKKQLSLRTGFCNNRT